jgi:glucose/arabinose dehydrogenase/mono/diheme cytochrome c family protein
MMALFSALRWREGVLAVLLANPGALCADEPQTERGRQLYIKHCFICHQFSGQGIPGVYPPLAKSDFLLEQKEPAIRAVVEGLSGEIIVNGKRYASAMPPVLIDDQDVADVLNYARNSWGNSAETISVENVQAVRAKTAFRTFERLRAANTFPPLPAAPEGFTLREVARMPSNPLRIASDGEGKLLYLLTGNNGDVWRLDPHNGYLRQVLWGERYLERRPGDMGGPVILVGMTMDKERRLYIASNQQNNSTRPVQNLVTIYRTTGFRGGDPVDPKPWFQTNYPGNSAYLHGLEHIAFGPDGYLYAANGARTDAAQPGTDTNYFMGGETEITACLWRIDPNVATPTLEVFARGLRNAYGFCWNDKGELFEVENGPDAHAPEELNLIEKGKHYGFPYRFGDWTHKAYAHTPDPPPGLEFTLPIPNVGPDGGYDGKPIYSFDPHSSPGGIVFLGDDFPDGWRGTFLMTRYGNFIRQPKKDAGFDLLKIKLRKNSAGQHEAEVRTVLAPLARPNDVHVSGRGKIYLSEYSRGTNSAASYTLPGRILELAVKPSAP